MKNAVINSLIENDEELFNRIKAYGPGDGINRPMALVEDQQSISDYGLRETSVDFSDAISQSDVLTKANEYLAEHKDPTTEVDITFYYEADIQLDNVLYEGQTVTYDGQLIQYYRYGNPRDIRRGDTIRIVSQELDLHTTGVIQEFDWEPGIINIMVGKPRYNLLSVILDPERDDERKKAALGLPEPVGLKAQRAEPGCKVFVNPYVNSRAIGTEIYAGSTAGFTPSVATLQAKGAGTEFRIPELNSGDVFYFKARSYDSEGSYSDIAGPVSAVSGFVQGGRIEGGTIDLSAFVGDARPVKIVSVLPTVISGDEDYPVGALVNYNGDLYKLISQTGTPSTDWIPAVDDGSIQADSITANSMNIASVSTAVLVADAIKAGMIDVDAVTAREIDAGTITANEIDAKTITANEIKNSTITDSLIKDSEITGAKIKGGTIEGTNIDGATIDGVNLKDYIIGTDQMADGDVEVSNSSKSNGAFIVKDSGNQEQVAMGKITNKPGVPSGTDYGFWGTLGTGVFIQGAPKFIGGVFAVLITEYNSGLAVSDTGGYNIDFVEGTIKNGPFTVPSGKKWLIAVSFNWWDLETTGSDGWAPRWIFLEPKLGTSTLFNPVISSGSYSGDIKFRTRVGVRNVSGSTNTEFNFSARATGLIWEVDD